MYESAPTDTMRIGARPSREASTVRSWSGRFGAPVGMCRITSRRFRFAALRASASGDVLWMASCSHFALRMALLVASVVPWRAQAATRQGRMGASPADAPYAVAVLSAVACPARVSSCIYACVCVCAQCVGCNLTMTVSSRLIDGYASLHTYKQRTSFV